ncbi:MAG: hypothetical protein FWG34_00090 [Oscillospiraceae bacterium]|nr:hypothetical protein [Oscillospiraceae bacterium]
MKKILLFVFGCAAIGAGLYFAVFGNIFRLEGFARAVMSVLSVVMCALLVYLLSFLLIAGKKPKEKEADFDFSMFGSGEERTAGLIDRINKYIAEMKQLNAYIADEGISGELSQIEEILRKMQPLLKDETIPAGRQGQLAEFFECYMPIIVKILNSYRRIENNRLKGGNADETKAQISKIMPVIKKGFEKELDNMFTDEMVDVTADVRVIESMLSKDGLVD